MHKYLRAIGFSKIESKKQLQELIKDIIHTANHRSYTNNGKDVIFTEYSKEFAENMGITVRGEFEEDNIFVYSHYFPFFKGSSISSNDDVSVERHAEKETYAGICDDLKVGVSLIFYLQNIVSYLKARNNDMLPVKGTTLILSGLSCAGNIMMAINKSEDDKEKIRRVSQDRSQLIEAARNGDEEAIESLTLEDMDTYSMISRKIQQEDVFSLVDTYFMPYGVECDQYSVLAEITECELKKNKMTSEQIYSMTLNCNDLQLDVCINKEDLYGEPAVGRRFKGTIWLQGFINFPD